MTTYKIPGKSRKIKICTLCGNEHYRSKHAKYCLSCKRKKDREQNILSNKKRNARLRRLRKKNK